MPDYHYTYILRCADGTLYTGYTTDPEKRLKTHNAGKGAKYTKTRRPCELVYTEKYDTKERAMSREWDLKHNYSRKEKLELIERYAAEHSSK